MRTKWTDEEGEELPSSRMAWSDLAVVAVDLLSAITTNVGLALGAVRTLVQQHANHEADGENFREEVTLDIETITEGNDG